MLALCDGETVLPLAPARDYKRALDGDRGPNTGGMGCISPVPGLDPSTVDELVATVHRPVIAELARRGIVFRGCLYAGLMLTDHGPSVLEFNARWGDPETQALVPRLDGDLLDALRRCAEGTLHRASLDVSGQACASVVLAAGGYPDAPEQGAEITGVEQAARLPGATVFHAGTALEGGRLVVVGRPRAERVRRGRRPGRGARPRLPGGRADQLRGHAAAHGCRGAGPCLSRSRQAPRPPRCRRCTRSGRSSRRTGRRSAS